MALLQSIEIQSTGIQPIEVSGTGLFATYCRITQVSVDFTATRDVDGQTIVGATEVLIHIYANAEARWDGKTPAAFRRAVFTSQDLPLDNLSRAVIYAALKLTPDFFEAEDI